MPNSTFKLSSATLKTPAAALSISRLTTRLNSQNWYKGKKESKCVIMTLYDSGKSFPSVNSPGPFKCSFPFSFFLLERPTHPHEREGDGKRNIKLGWPYDNYEWVSAKASTFFPEKKSRLQHS